MLENKYRKDREGSIVSYDFTDISSGSGYINFYGMISENNSSKDYYLIDEVLKSSEAGEDLQSTTLTFDSFEFNLPKTLNGNVYISCAIITATNGNSATFNLKIVHEDATTTSLGSVTSKTVTDNDERALVFLSVSNQRIKKGEKIRIEVSDNTDHSIWIGTSPTGKPTSDVSSTYGSSDITSEFILGLPFDIDL